MTVDLMFAAFAAHRRFGISYGTPQLSKPRGA
jgi:hypothetical protein